MKILSMLLQRGSLSFKYKSKFLGESAAANNNRVFQNVKLAA